MIKNSIPSYNVGNVPSTMYFIQIRIYIYIQLIGNIISTMTSKNDFENFIVWDDRIFRPQTGFS